MNFESFWSFVKGDLTVCLWFSQKWFGCFSCVDEISLELCNGQKVVS